MVVVALDSGGTKINAAVVDHTGRILEKRRWENRVRDGDRFVAIYCEAIAACREKYPVEAVGLACNGLIDPEHGIVLRGPGYANWDGRPIAEELSGKTGLPVALGNDCILGAFGEWWCGALRPYDTFVAIMLGTGVGGALVDHGRLVTGNRFGAGEIGHMLLHPGGYPCVCGQEGCVERYVSGTALWTIYNQHAGTQALDSGYAFFERYHAGDPLAKKVMDGFVSDLAQVLVSLSFLCAPQAILIGGGLADTHDIWCKALETRYRSMLSPIYHDIRLLYAERGNDAAILGAAKAALGRAGKA